MIFISDLHMGIGDGRDDFTREQEDGLIRVMNVRPSEPIGIVGDWTDVQQVREHGEVVESTALRIELAHPRICDLFRERAEEHLLWAARGNHDEDLLHFCGVMLHHALVVSKRIAFHGHQLDRLCYGKWSWIGRAATRVAGLAELIHPEADMFLSRSARWTFRMGRYGSKDHYSKEALKLLAKFRVYEGIIVGHTHKVDTLGRYHNTGCWVNGHQDWLRLPFKGDHVRGVG